MYKVYCHIFPNGKRYIGLTGKDCSERWQNGKGYKTCPLMNRAINKYGWENVEHLILRETETLEEAENLERNFIREYRTDVPDFGYNVLPGGDVSSNSPSEETRKKLGNGWRGKKRSEEDRRKISEGVKRRFDRAETNGHKGMKASDETKQKMSESQRASWENDDRRVAAAERMRKRMQNQEYKKKIIDNLSKHGRVKGEWKMPESAKEKLSAANTGRWLGEKSSSSKPVLQYTVDGKFVKRWANAGEAERAGVANRCNISACCVGKAHCKTAGGYVWKHEVAE